MKLKKAFNDRKAVDFPWTYEVTKYASQQPFLHLQAAFRRFFEKKACYPQFKRKGVHDGFYIGGDQLEVSGRRIRIPRLGWVDARGASFSGKVVSATVRRMADRWFVSVQVELEESPMRCESQACIGVDLGVNRLATLSNGVIFEGPKALRRHLKRLKRSSRRLSRKRKGSGNRDKARRKLGRLHFRIRCIRQDALHKLTSYLTENYGAIAIENLNVKGMLSNRRLARAVADMGFYEFRRQLDYKTQMRRNHLEVAGRWFASSKTCSECGFVKQYLSLGERRFRCERCGFESDPDLNAALNLFRTVSSTGSQACGEEGSGSSSRWSETILCESGTWV